MLVGLCGAAGAGKDSVAKILVEYSSQPFVKGSFAQPLYQCVSAITGMPISKLQDRAFKEQVIPWLGKSPRQLLQSLGTEWGRDMVDPEIWIRIAMDWAGQHTSNGWNVVITDVRFQNEAKAVLNAGGEVWRVQRPTGPRLDGDAASHSSEAGIDDRFVSRVIDNSGSLDDLRAQVSAATI